MNEEESIRNLKRKISATRIVASTFGIMTGLNGVEHGYFETLQGNVAPSGIILSAVSPPLPSLSPPRLRSNFAREISSDAWNHRHHRLSIGVMPQYSTPSQVLNKKLKGLRNQSA